MAQHSKVLLVKCVLTLSSGHSALPVEVTCRRGNHFSWYLMYIIQGVNGRYKQRRQKVLISPFYTKGNKLPYHFLHFRIYLGGLSISVQRHLAALFVCL